MKCIKKIFKFIIVSFLISYSKPILASINFYNPNPNPDHKLSQKQSDDQIVLKDVIYVLGAIGWCQRVFSAGCNCLNNKTQCNTSCHSFLCYEVLEIYFRFKLENNEITNGMFNKVKRILKYYAYHPNMTQEIEKWHEKNPDTLLDYFFH